MAAAARIAGAFETTIAKTTRRMHAAEEEIRLRPNFGVGAHFEDLLGAAKAGLETYRAGFLDMEARGFDSVFEAHAEVEEIHRDLQDRGADAVRAAGP